MAFIPYLYGHKGNILLYILIQTSSKNKLPLLIYKCLNGFV